MYIDGFVTPVPKKNKDAYIKHLEEVSPLIKEIGVIRMVESWGDEIPQGEQTDFLQAVKLKDDETVLFGWFEWPSKEVRDKGVKTMMEDKRFQEMNMPFDGKRMIFGGFSSIFDKKF